MRMAIALIWAASLMAQVPSWSGTTPLAEARYGACAVRLNDGRILVTGGTGVDGTPLGTGELYQTDASFAPASPMLSARTRHACILLADGRVLAAGGEASGAAELYDPVANSWQAVDGTGQPRLGSTITLLRDRRVLIAGGASPDGTALTSIEVCNPQEGTLTPLSATLSVARDGFTAVLQGDGTVLFIGGTNADGVLNSTDVYSPLDDSVVAGPPMNVARTSHSATVLLDGRILVAGGFDGTQELDSAELYDPAAGAFVLLDAHLRTARRDHLAIFVPGNGGVLLAGGRQADQALVATELFQPVDGTFALLGDLTAPRYALAGAAVTEGLILATGGLNADGPQAACGLLLLPSIQVSKSLYRPGDTVQVSGNGFRPNTKINFTLELVSGGVPALSNGRLITPGVTTVQGTQFQIITGFSSVPIMAVSGNDAGKTVLIIAQTPDGTTVQTTATVRIATSLTLTQPVGLYEGLNGTFLAQLNRTASTVPMTGLFVFSISSNGCSGTSPGQVTDGTSNTVLLSETAPPDSTSATLNAVVSSFFLSKTVTNVPLSQLRILASYAGDVANDPVAASSCFVAVSRTPNVQLTVPPDVTLRAGGAFNLTATVVPQQGSTTPGLNGAVSFSLENFPLGAAQNSAKTGTSLTATRQFIPLTVGTLDFAAQYSGDTFFRNASSPVLPVTIQKAISSIALISPPATYHCDAPYSAGVQLNFPGALGLANQSVSLQSTNAGGSVRIVPGSATALTVSTAGLGAGTVNVASMPSSVTSIQAVFTGDSLVQAAQSAVVPLTLVTTPVTVEVVSAAGPQSNPVTFQVKINPQGCVATPTGNLEILDVGVPVVVVPVTGLTTSVTLSRPPGSHVIQARYSGDRVYQPASSAATTIVFQ